MVLVLTIFAIGACGGEDSRSLRTAAPPAAPEITTSLAPLAEMGAPVSEPSPVVISDKLALERLPATFEPLVAAESTVGRFGEHMAWQRFVSYTRRGSVIVSIAHGRPATELLAEPSYVPSPLSTLGLSLFEYQNRTTLTSNALAWSIAPDVVVGVTSREISKLDLLEWIPLINAQA
jgi:hypothetical protein